MDSPGDISQEREPKFYLLPVGNIELAAYSCWVSVIVFLNMQNGYNGSYFQKLQWVCREKISWDNKCHTANTSYIINSSWHGKVGEESWGNGGGGKRQWL